MYTSLKKNLVIFGIISALFACGSVFAIDGDMLNVPVLNTILKKEKVTEETVNSKEFQNKTIRVLISNRGSFDQKEIILSSDEEIFITSDNKLITTSTGMVSIYREEDNIVINSQGTISKVPSSKKILVQTDGKLIKIDNFVKKSKKASYKGDLEIFSQKGNSLRIINIIDIEDYIKGVVPNEMPVYFGLEALKAQAISARGYAYRDASYKTTGYDVCDTTGSQVYNGANSYDPISDKAVDETMGQFALYDGKVILSLYSSTAGGHTESYENVFSLNGTNIKFPSEPIPYLTGVSDNYEEMDLTKEINAAEFYKNSPESFDKKSPKYRWEYTWTKQELTDILTKNLMKFSNSPFVKPSLKKVSDFGEFVNIDIPKRGVSGKAMYARITTDKATFLIAKEIMIRQIFTYNNKWLPSANIVIERLDDGHDITGFKFYGGGFGHGVGLSQYGAMGMAKKGYTYDKILKHYYKGISIGSYPVECSLGELKNCKASFYAHDKNAKLILNYSQKPHDIIFDINGHRIAISASNLSKNTGKVDIKKWMKKGINNIEVTEYDRGILVFSNPVIKFYVELDNKNEK